MPNYMTELSPDNNNHVYQIKDKEAAPINLLKDTVGWSGKNILKVASNVVSYSASGVDVVVNRNSDGEVTEIDFNGTSSANITLTLCIIAPNNGKYIINKGVSTSVLGVVVEAYNDSTWKKVLAQSYSTDEIAFDADYNDYDRIRISIKMESGKVANHVKIYPMLRDASIIDSTYEPYHKSVEEILETKGDWDARNLLDPIYLKDSISNSGVALTKQADGSMTISNTASATANIQISVDSGVKIKNGNYIFSIGRVIKVRVIGYANGNYTLLGEGSEGEVAFTASSTYEQYYLQISVVSGTAYSGYIYPMIQLASNANKDYTSHRDTLDVAIPSKLSYADNGILGAKNLLDKSVAVGITADVAVTQTSNGVRGVVASSSTWKSVSLVIPNPSKNTNLILTDYANITSGRSIQKVEGTDNKTTFTTIKESDTGITTSANQSLAFNSGSYNYLRIQLYVTGGSGYETGDITFENIMLRLASDPDSTYQPYAMTNRELTEIAKLDSFSLGEATCCLKVVRKCGIVELCRDTVSAITANTDTSVGQLPVGYRPANTIACHMASYDDNKCMIQINSSGYVTIRSNKNNYFLPMVMTFIAEQ